MLCYCCFFNYFRFHCCHIMLFLLYNIQTLPHHTRSGNLSYAGIRWTSVRRLSDYGVLVLLVSA